ncbi:MAG: glycerophosphodiester phosphodiesterase family protein [Caulobacteraceae bacterium]
MSLPVAFQAAPIAHRGLWRSGGAPENSLAAFEAACRAGYGIELDVRLSADGEAMVFHDETLERLTASAGLVEEQTADDLQALRLLGSCETIPTLAEVLALVDGRAPLLVELKTPVGQEGLQERRVAELLADYAGPVAVLSFNALALAWLADHAPTLRRGLNVARLDQLADAERARADFLSVQLDLAGHDVVQGWRRMGEALAWTCRTPADLARVHPYVENLMFEGFNP